MVTILVTGATGLNGKQIVHSLLKKGGVKVRAAVRDEAKAQDLKAAGAELVIADLDKPDTLDKAFSGVDRVLLLAPFSEHFEKLFENGVNAAKKAGVKFILKFSATGADPKSNFFLSRKHGLTEDLVKNSGIPFAIVQPTFFSDNFASFDATPIKNYGQFTGASGHGKAPYISSKDITNVSVEILLNPEKHNGKSYPITGPEAIDAFQVAQIFSEVIGKPVKYNDLPEEEYRKQLTSWGTPSL